MSERRAKGQTKVVLPVKKRLYFHLVKSWAKMYVVIINYKRHGTCLIHPKTT